MTPENLPERGEAPAVNFYGLAQRAGAILRRMEQCSPLALRTKQHSSLSTASDTRLVDDNSKEMGEYKSEGESDGDDRLGSANLAEESYQGVYSDFPRHLASLKYALPTPTRSIYNMVLKSYAKELGLIHIAQEAEDVIWSMIVRAMQLQTSQNESKDDGDKEKDDSVKPNKPKPDALFPSTENWNCALKCWSRSTDPDRAFHAYSFLTSWMEWSKQYQANGEEDNNPNSESFQLVLRSCLVESGEFKDMELQRAEEMGSGVAIRLWKERSETITLDSTLYHQVIQAICQTSELPSTSSNTAALQALVRVFIKCHRDGMVTLEILDLVQAATTKSQFAQIRAKLSS